MGCDLEHFVVEYDQQCRKIEQAGKGEVDHVSWLNGHVGLFGALPPQCMTTCSVFDVCVVERFCRSKSMVNDWSEGAQWATRLEKG